jgi:hypothetical protein
VGRRAMEIKKFIKLKFYELTVYILLLIFLLHNVKVPRYLLEAEDFTGHLVIYVWDTVLQIRLVLDTTICDKVCQ